MKSRIIYICSPYAGNTEENTAFARQACGYAIRQGAVPLAPHLLYPQILNDSVPEEREQESALGWIYWSGVRNFGYAVTGCRQE